MVFRFSKKALSMGCRTTCYNDTSTEVDKMKSTVKQTRPSRKG